MPMAAVELKPGVNTQETFALNMAGISQSQLIRYKTNLVQAYGGWDQLVSFTVPSTVRDLHPWQDSNGVKYLGVGGTNNLSVIINSASISDVTPQTTTTDFTPNFSISSGSNQITVVDPNSGATTFNTAYFNTPVAIGNILLNGAYPIVSVLSTGSYIITSSVVASTTIASSGILPIFDTTNGSASVTVTLPNNGFQSIPGLFQQFIAPTSIAGQTIQGKYLIASVLDSTQFIINLTQQASATSTATMNNGNAEITYYITLGPVATVSGFGSGGFGSGGFGTGSAIIGTPGTPITATDWTLDNWGEILLACPENGAIYQWGAHEGVTTAQVVNQGPFFNGGIFISQPQQILVAWRSDQSTGVQNNLEVRWSDAGDYTNWVVSNQTSAGSFVIPTGSYIVGGRQCPTFGMISTDIDVWVMQYVGGDVIFNFTRVGTGCGWIGKHACGILGGNPYWMAENNFFTLSGSGVVPIPCTVWDAVFQNINTNFQTKCVCGVNSTFNELTWFYPSASSTGECDSYVKLHLEGQEFQWDYGLLPRTAWEDISILGNPISADTQGFLYQHEEGTMITGVSLPSFRSGWWAITEGNDMAFVDFIMPDFQWGLRTGAQDAQIAITFFSADYPGDTPISYGPYVVTQGTEYINTRIRGRLMSVLIQSQNSEFWRLGRIRYRWAPAGRR